MGSQGLDPDGGHALVGRSDDACSPHGPGELSPVRQAPRRCHPSSVTRQPVNTA